MNKLKFALCMAIYSLLVSFLAVYGSFFLANVLYNFNSGNSLLDFDFSGFFLNGFKTSIKMIILLWGLLFVSSYFGYGKKYNIF